MDLPLPLIGIIIAVIGYLVTTWLWSRPRPPLVSMRPEFDQTALDEGELGNEAMDMELIRKVQAENERIGIESGYRWNKPAPRSKFKE
ncbi:MAG: hypothetical protein AAFU41_07955 [Pseudomonadota bacterium]